MCVNFNFYCVFLIKNLNDKAQSDIRRLPRQAGQP